MNYLYLTYSGVLLQLILTIVNRFIFRIPNRVQIPLMILGVVLIIAGILMTKK